MIGVNPNNQKESSTNSELEANRLNKLQSYGILDTIPEEDFDNITFMASMICGTPISLISLVDKNRQWFKSNHGLAVRETPREYSFCAHGIYQDAPFIVEDARQDPRFKDNPLVRTDPHIVFYAGIPLRDEEGIGLGSVCVIDRIPRQLTKEQFRALNILASLAMEKITLRKRDRELRIIKEQLLRTNSVGALPKGSEKSNNSLEGFVSNQIKILGGKNKDLEWRNRELANFVYISSHHLQEPLRKMQSLISILEHREGHKISGRSRNYLRRLNSAAVRIRSLISDFQKYCSIDLSQDKFTFFEYSEVFKSVKEDLNSLILKKNATVSLIGNLKLSGVHTQIILLSHILIENALIYSREDISTEIIVRCEKITTPAATPTGLRPLTEYHLLSFEDNGIGFDPNYQFKLFDIFQRLANDPSRPGNGLGLALAQRIVKHHYGHISAKSKPKEMTQIRVYLPVLDKSHIYPYPLPV